MGSWWKRLSHWRRGVLGVFALLAVLAIAAFVTERLTGFGGHEAERSALSSYVEALRPAFKINVTMTTRVFTLPDSASGEDYIALYREAVTQYSHAAAIVEATKPPKELAAAHEGVAAGFRAYASMYRQVAKLMDHLASVEHTDAEVRAHQAELQRIFEKGFGDTSARPWVTALAKDYERLHLDTPGWFTEYGAQMRKLMQTTESPQP